MQALYNQVVEEVSKVLDHAIAGNTASLVTLGQDGRSAYNAHSNREYLGMVNQLLLGQVAKENGFVQNGWITYRQAVELGGYVMPGEKHTKIYFRKYNYYDKDGKRHSEEAVKGFSRSEKRALKLRRARILRFYQVFNLVQTAGLPDRLFVHDSPKALNPAEKFIAVENMITEKGVTMQLHSSATGYDPVSDTVLLNEQEHDPGAILRAVAAWTGHETRLHRPEVEGNSDAYHLERLLEEMAAEMLAVQLGFELPMSQSKSQLMQWKFCLKERPETLFILSNQAQRVVDFVTEKATSKESDSKEKVSL